MSGHEEVVFAFFWVRISHHAPFATDGREVAEPTGHELVRIDLMPGVPDQPVFREVENLMQRNTQLNNTEVAGEVSGAVSANRTERFADFRCQLAKLLIRKSPHISR